MNFIRKRVVLLSIPWRKQPKEAVRLNAVLEANFKKLGF